MKSKQQSLAGMKRTLDAAQKVYEAIKDLPRDKQRRVLEAAVVLLNVPVNVSSENEL